MPPSPNNTPPMLKLFRTFGGELEPNGSGQAVGDCPYCGKEGKFYLNEENGLHDCKSCGQTGNASTFIQHIYAIARAATTDAQLRTLRDERSVPLQTLKRFGVAWQKELGEWLLPALSKEGKVKNLIRYNPLRNPSKLSLPGLPACLFGLDQLSNDSSKPIWVFEGFWDLVAADHHFREKKVRERYDLLAVPGANVFKTEWKEYFAGRKATLFFDNDKAGRDGQQRTASIIESVAREVIALHWPDGFREKADASDLIKQGVGIVSFAKEHCIPVDGGGLKALQFVRGDEVVKEKVYWLWNNHLQFGTFVSLAGLMGTHKSGCVRDWVARATAGLPFPLCDRDSALPPMDVLYFTSEDAAAQIVELVEIAGGDVRRLHIHDIASTLDPVDVLDRLGEIEALIKSMGVRLVVLDALNSFCGGDISSDSKARKTLSGRLQQLARRTGACVIGIRNWGRGDSSQSSQQRALGATSLSDVARCVLNTVELPPIDEGAPRRFELNFEKVSNAPQQPPMPYEVEDLSTPAASYLRRIVWRERATEERIREVLGSLKKGSEKTPREKVAVPLRVVGE